MGSGVTKKIAIIVEAKASNVQKVMGDIAKTVSKKTRMIVGDLSGFAEEMAKAEKRFAQFAKALRNGIGNFDTSKVFGKSLASANRQLRDMVASSQKLGKQFISIAKSGKFTGTIKPGAVALGVGPTAASMTKMAANWARVGRFSMTAAGDTATGGAPFQQFPWGRGGRFSGTNITTGRVPPPPPPPPAPPGGPGFIGKGLDQIAGFFARQGSAASIAIWTKAVDSATNSLVKLWNTTTNFLSDAVNASGRWERMALSIEVMTGSAVKGKEVLQKLVDLASTGALPLEDLIAAQQRLQGFGFSADRSTNMLANLGNLFAASNLPMHETMMRVTLALGQMHSKTRVMAQEMNQLTEAQIPAWDMLREHIEKTNGPLKKSIQDMVEAGEVSGDVGMMAIVEGSKRYEGLLERQGNTLLGLWAKVRTKFFLFSKDLGDAIVKFADLKGLEIKIGEFLDRLRSKIEGWGAYFEARGGIFRALVDVGFKGLDALLDYFDRFNSLLQSTGFNMETWYQATIKVIGDVGAFFIGLYNILIDAVSGLLGVAATLDETLKGEGRWGVFDYIGFITTGQSPDKPTTKSPLRTASDAIANAKGNEQAFREWLGGTNSIDAAERVANPQSLISHIFQSLEKGLATPQGKFNQRVLFSMAYGIADKANAGGTPASKLFSDSLNLLDQMLTIGAISSEEYADAIIEVNTAITGFVQKAKEEIKPFTYDEFFKQVQGKVRNFRGKGDLGVSTFASTMHDLAVAKFFVKDGKAALSDEDYNAAAGGLYEEMLGRVKNQSIFRLPEAAVRGSREAAAAIGRFEFGDRATGDPVKNIIRELKEAKTFQKRNAEAAERLVEAMREAGLVDIDD